MIQLGEVAMLAQYLVQADREVDDAEEALSAAKERARRLREEALPGAMEELGLKELTLEDGAKITASLEVYCSIPAGYREQAFAWLDKNNFGGLIKTQVTLPFGRSATEQAELRGLRERLTEDGYTFEEKQDVHPMTLKAWLKEQLREGAKKVPLHFFGARPVTVAKVKLPKG